jgi:ribulose-5-phosphate 4-epimerase/fuculose-1-phosphate aldolase
MYEDVKEQAAIANRVLAEVGLCNGITASLGHISMRVPGHPEHFLVKGRGYEIDALPRITPADMVVCDLEGNRVEARPGAMQCFEVKIHSCILRDHPDMNSVCHVHPRHTVLMSTLGQTLRPMAQEGAQVVAKPLPVWNKFRLVSTEEDGAGVSKLLGPARAILLRGHGAVTAGSNLEQCFMTMYTLEEQARLNYQALAALGPDYPCIPDELLNEPNPPRTEMPHFKESETVLGSGPRVGGVWAHYTELIKERFKAEGVQI